MTEAEWLRCADPGPMLEHLGPEASERKLRLFAVACCRRNAGQLTDPSLRASVEVGEAFADGAVSQKRRGAAQAAARDALARGRTSPPCFAFAASLCSVKGIRLWVHTAWYQSGTWSRRHEADSADLLREIAGNPFRAADLDPSWQTSAVRALGLAAYEHRQLPSGHLDNDRLAVLADALEEAGCTDADILNHLRGHGVHVRGCWALDLVLDKE